jgi:hypothetical protein
MKRSTRLGSLLLAALFVVILPNTVRADSVYVTLTSPGSSEWGEDTYGGIWHANLDTGLDAYNNPIPVGSNALTMCSGDYRDIYIGQRTGPYSQYDLLNAPQTVVQSDPGSYGFPTSFGFSLGSRTQDVKAEASFLADQMNNAVLLPSNLQGHAADDWIEVKGDALVGAIHTVWDGVPFAPEVETGSEAWENSVRWHYYNQYMAAVAGINSTNYTSSSVIWLIDPSDQVLFAKFSPTDVPDPTTVPNTVPEPSTLTMFLGLGGFGIVGWWRKRRTA